MTHCRFYMNKIIKEADYISFISPMLKNSLEEKLNLKMKKILNRNGYNAKLTVIGMGREEEKYKK